MHQIDLLTPEQESELVAYREKWLRIGLSTESVNHANAAAYGKKLMRFLGREHVATVVMPSPLSAWMAVQMLASGQQVWQQVDHQVRHQVHNQVYQQVRQQVRQQVHHQVHNQVYQQVRHQVDQQVYQQVDQQVYQQVRQQVYQQVYHQVHNQVYQQVRQQVWQQVWQQVETFIWPCLSREWWCGWASIYDFCESALLCKLADWSIIRDATNFGPIYPLENCVVISDVPRKIALRDGRLHCEDGAAIAYADGLSVYALGGVQVDEQIVLRPETQTVEQIRGEQNEEVKRLRIERYGWKNFLAAMGAKRIDARRNDVDGTRESLYQCDGMSVLVCACPSTAKLFSLEVPPQTATCEAAQAFLSSGLSARVISAS